MNIAQETMAPKLPRSVQEIADVIGRDLAIELVSKLPRAYSRGHPSGEAILYVPKRLPLDHALVRLIGWEAAYKLSRHFPGEILKPAITAEDVIRRWERNQQIRARLREGCDPSQIAKDAGISLRWVQKIAKSESPRQENLNANLNTAAA